MTFRVDRTAAGQAPRQTGAPGLPGTKTRPARAGTSHPRRFARLRRDRALLLLAVPGLVLLLLFQYVPLLGNIIAFEDYEPYYGIVHSNWAGLSNFAVIFNGDPVFLSALRNTLVITLLQVVLVFPVPIALALLLNSMPSERLKRLVQSILYLPHFLSWVIVVAIFQEMLGNSGLLDDWLRSNGHPTLAIIGNASLFKALLTSQVIWKDSGWATILFLAALSQIDAALYEAASVESGYIHPDSFETVTSDLTTNYKQWFNAGPRSWTPITTRHGRSSTCRTSAEELRHQPHGLDPPGRRRRDADQHRR